MFPSTEHLKNFKFITQLHSGGFGKIKLYQCKNSNCKKDDNQICNELFVVKKIRVHTMDSLHVQDTNEYKLEILLNEYTIGSELDHINIIKTYDINIDTYSLFLEHCPGIDLFDYLNKPKYLNGYRNMTKFAKLYMQLLDAVSYLHSKNIAHMDLKLENIMYNKQENCIKLIDFGQAEYFKINGVYQNVKKLKGTKQYLAPECLETDRYYTGDKIDVWCLLIILYNLVYNDTPWESACIKDKSYVICIDHYKKYKKLNPNIFTHPIHYGYILSDANIILKILEYLFHDIRPSVQEIMEQFSQLSLFSVNDNTFNSIFTKS